MEAAISACPVYTSPPAHPADSWLIAHVMAQTQYGAEHRMVCEVLSRIRAQLSSYSIDSFVSGLVNVFDKGDRLVSELGEATKRLEQALDEEQRKADEVKQQQQQVNLQAGH